jgi:hypothetical protein
MADGAAAPSLDFLVWPPLPGLDSPELLRCAASVAWFAGPVARRIFIPALDAPAGSSPGGLPDYVSLGALSDLPKVHLVSVAEAEERAASRQVTVLMRERNAGPHRLLAVSAPMPGSLLLEGVPRAAAELKPLRYYYIGMPENDLQDAYYGVCLSYWAQGGEDAALLAASRAELLRLREEASSFDEVSLFGTGPSLGEALDRDFSRSFNIVCNTIIKNRVLVEQLNPKVLVASDAHFHFSYHRYSARFLADVVDFLHRGDGAFFTFDKFAAFVRRRLPDVAHRIFGIPAGRTAYGYDFDRDFRLFPGDSVLNMFLLPMGSFLGETVSLHGFTGRAPSDTYFWSHSELHQYTDLMDAVRQAHPAFFRNRDYGGYAGNVDEDILRRVMHARAAGKSVRSRTTSFYTAFAQ